MTRQFTINNSYSQQDFYESVQNNEVESVYIHPNKEYPTGRVACKEGIDAFFPIIRGATTLNEAMDIKNAQKNMKNTAQPQDNNPPNK